MTALIISLGLLICGVVWAFMADGKDDAKKDYEMFYSRIEGYIYTWPPELNFKTILSKQLEMLEEMPYKNPEKTEVLKDRFYRKFKKVNP